jgi:hypothetical protein
LCFILRFILRFIISIVQNSKRQKKGKEEPVRLLFLHAKVATKMARATFSATFFPSPTENFRPEIAQTLYLQGFQRFQKGIKKLCPKGFEVR